MSPLLLISELLAGPSPITYDPNAVTTTRAEIRLLAASRQANEEDLNNFCARSWNQATEPKDTPAIDFQRQPLQISCLHLEGSRKDSTTVTLEWWVQRDEGWEPVTTRVFTGQKAGNTLGWRLKWTDFKAQAVLHNLPQSGQAFLVASVDNLAIGQVLFTYSYGKPAKANQASETMDNQEQPELNTR